MLRRPSSFTISTQASMYSLNGNGAVHRRLTACSVTPNLGGLEEIPQTF
jgi:hypothetical protein